MPTDRLRWAYTRDADNDTTHIARLDEHGKADRSLCGTVLAKTEWLTFIEAPICIDCARLSHVPGSAS
jgi:hypothetical protein